MEPIFKVFFRTSKSFGKNPPPNTSDKITYKSLLESFDKSEITVICDNTTEDQISYFKSINNDVHITKLGNCESFRYQLNIAKEYEWDIGYFVENDHLHLPNQKSYIKTGLSLFKIVSLYDHPDKYYLPMYNYLKRKIHCTSTGYWASTPSTVMTFAMDKKVFNELYNTMMSDEFTGNSHSVPQDHYMFLKFNQMGYDLGTPLPGISTHLDIGGHSPYIDWNSYINHLNNK